MRKNNMPSHKHYYKTNDGRWITTKFKLGDIVRVDNLGRRYDYYEDAFRFFNILDKTKENGGYCWLGYPYDLRNNWIVNNIAIHNNGYDILYHLINRKKQHVIINEDGISQRNICGKELKSLILKNKKFILQTIPKYS